MIIKRTDYNKKIINALENVPIVALIGARQVGKTTIMKNLPIEKDSIFLDAQDPETAELFKKHSVLKEYLEIHLNKDLNGILMIDEFQFINDISLMLKLMVDHNPKLSIICSGSSSINILQNVKESLAGRIRLIKVYSLSFSEYLLFKNEKLNKLYVKYSKDTSAEIIDPKIKLALNEYIIYGGLPRVALASEKAEKAALLDDIYKTYLLRDVRSFVKNEDFVGFNRLLKLLAYQTGNMININNLSKECGLSYRKTEEYLYVLEQMYIIKLLQPFHSNYKKVIRKMQKIFFTDNGIRNIVMGALNAIDNRNDSGALLENYVFLELSRNLLSHYKLYYYRTLDGAEIDFIVDNMKTLFPVEVKNSSFKKTKNLKNISSFSEFHSCGQAYVVNRNLNKKNEAIHFIPSVLSGKLIF
ncbi:MAG: ATP-binding protein [Bacteroidota bacterium]